MRNLSDNDLTSYAFFLFVRIYMVAKWS